ncbi:MAG: siphovirus Gp157 family protein [Bryobacteraceae bacterium]
MATAIAILPATEPSAVVAERLATLLRQAETESIGDDLPQFIRDQAADLIEVLRGRVRVHPERDPRSLFDIDDHLVELMNRAEDEANENGDIPESLAQEITDYLEAFRGKVDRIAGYWRWQESIGEICGRESDRLAARKRAADARVVRLRFMLQAFMQPRSLKRLEGEKAAIGSSRTALRPCRSTIPFRWLNGFGSDRFALPRLSCKRSRTNWPKASSDGSSKRC